MTPTRYNPIPQHHLTMLCARFWPERHGGVEQRAWHVSRALAQRGWRVRVLTENRSGHVDRESPKRNVTIERFTPLDPGRLWRWTELLRVRWWRRNIVTADPPGTIWATDPLMAAAAILAGRGRDLIFNPACCAAAMNHTARQYPYVTTLRTSRTLRRFDDFAFNRAGRTIVGSENLKRQLIDFYGNQHSVHVVPHGVEPPDTPTLKRLNRATCRRRFGLDNQSFVVGFVGRLDPIKDLGFLFAAMRSAKLTNNTRLLIAGAGPDRERLERLAQMHELGSRIVWTGHMDDPTPAYRAMDLLVLPSIYEAFGNVLLEAMAAGTPVVGRRRSDDQTRPVLTANDELIEHGVTGLLVDPHEPDDLADALRLLSGSPGTVRAMGRCARRHALEHPWEKTIEAYEALLGDDMTLARAA